MMLYDFELRMNGERILLANPVPLVTRWSIEKKSGFDAPATPVKSKWETKAFKAEETFEEILDWDCDFTPPSRTSRTLAARLTRVQGSRPIFD